MKNFYRLEVNRQLRDIREQMKNTLSRIKRMPRDEFDWIRDEIYEEAMARVPRGESGVLADSIDVHVAARPREVMFVARAKAINTRDGYDYAPIQHEEESYSHEEGQAHYLSEPMEIGAELLEARVEELLDELSP